MLCIHICSFRSLILFPLMIFLIKVLEDGYGSHYQISVRKVDCTYHFRKMGRLMCKLFLIMWQRRKCQDVFFGCSNAVRVKIKHLQYHVTFLSSKPKHRWIKPNSQVAVLACFVISNCQCITMTPNRTTCCNLHELQTIIYRSFFQEGKNEKYIIKFSSCRNSTS